MKSKAESVRANGRKRAPRASALPLVSLPEGHGLAPPALTMTSGLLYQADCMDLFGALRPESVDCVFADPPFNLGKDYGNGAHSDSLGQGEYLAWTHAWVSEAARVLKPGGAIFVYMLPRWGYQIASFLEALGLEFRHWIALSMKGTFPRGYKLYPAHYAILYFTKGLPKTFNRVRLPIPTCRHCGKEIKDYGGHRKYLNPLGLNLTDFWEDTAPARHRKHKARWHVNELKPMVPGRCFEISTNPGDIVLDPFGGGGSSYESAHQRGRLWIGSEINSCQPIVERLSERFPGEVGARPPQVVMNAFHGGTDAQDRRGKILQRGARQDRKARPYQAWARYPLPG